MNILLHGWPGAFYEFHGVFPVLAAAGHRVMVPSLPRYGYSEGNITLFEFHGVFPVLAAAGYRVMVPSLPRYGYSEGNITLYKFHGV